MLKDGKYSVWFRTPLAEGMGVVVLAPNGKLSGQRYHNGVHRALARCGRAVRSYRFRYSDTHLGPGAFGEVDDIEVS